ncbi:hypothetical protein AVEN_111878-1 [Araneus ventricosus]|uniref:Uncharacterized protein n=1 Tax=Araneus ventricosus TaxID=182803 RepID=A0A4Y2BY74_ARAVE|nr:hypothetical protein AVEN_111878-1 [Araneus ventricosus]
MHLILELVGQRGEIQNAYSILINMQRNIIENEPVNEKVDGRTLPLIYLKGVECGGLVSSRLRGWRVIDSKPDSIEEPLCKRVWCTLIPSEPNVLSMVRCGSRKRGYRLRHLTTVQNRNVRPNISLVLLQTREVNITKLILRVC